jgi:hypothetical protein
MMSRTSVVIVFIFFISSPDLFSGTLTLTGGADDFSFDYYENDTPNIFRTPYYMPIVNVEMQGEFWNVAYYTAGFQLDPVLRYLLHGEAVFNLWAFRLGLGSFISMFTEGDEDHVPGFSGSVGIELPGGLTFFIEYGSNAFTDLSVLGNTNLHFGSVNLSIWMPHIVTHFRMFQKAFIQARGPAYTIGNSLLRYEAMLDIYAKTLPLIITLGGGYEDFTKSLAEIPGKNYAGEVRDSSLELLFGTLKLDIESSTDFHLLLSVESGPPISSGFYFSAYVGFKIVSQNW